MPDACVRKGRGAYGIRTRATAVRGRRPRPLDECAVPRQSSRSVKRSASQRERPGRRPLSKCAASDGRSESLRAHADCADSRMRLQEAGKGAEGGPASCGPNAEPPYRARVLPPCSPHAANPEGAREPDAYLTRRTRAATRRGRGFTWPKVRSRGGGGRRAWRPPPPGGKVASYGPTRPSLPGPPD